MLVLVGSMLEWIDRGHNSDGRVVRKFFKFQREEDWLIGVTMSLKNERQHGVVE
jgi:hypothetical protein